MGWNRNLANLLIILISIIFSLIACEPSQNTIQTAIAQTMAANPTSTPTITRTITPIPSNTLTNTPTPTLTATITPSATFTPSPTPDLRIIDIDPQKFLIKQEDFPREGLYYLPGPGWIGKNTNDMIIVQWGVAKGREYVINTGRVSAWWEYYDRGTLAARLPNEIMSEVALYKTSTGAQLALNKYNPVEAFPLDGWKYINRAMTLGDANITIALYKIDAGGQKNTYYLIEFAYRNVIVKVYGWAYKEEDVPPDILENLARIVLKKLQEAPLVNPEDAVLAK